MSDDIRYVAKSLDGLAEKVSDGLWSDEHELNIPTALEDIANQLRWEDDEDREINVPRAVVSIASAIHSNFTSPNELDQNWEAANVVDGLFAIARSISRLAKAVETVAGVQSPPEPKPRGGIPLEDLDPENEAVQSARRRTKAMAAEAGF